MPPSQPSRAPVHLRCYPSAAAGRRAASHNRGMSLSLPEGDGPLRRERLRTARLYFVCDARPHGDLEALLRAALTGGADIVQLREKELGRAEIERAAQTFRRVADTFSALFIVNDDPELARQLRRRRRPRRPGRRQRRAGAGAARARRDRRPLDPLRGADRRQRRAPRRLHKRRADLGDADEGGAARRSGSS